MTEEYSPVSVNRDVGTEEPSLWIHSSEEPSSTEREHKRITHNNSEKQRKEKIKSKIANIGHLLPTVRSYEKQSTLSILERAADYISEIQDKNDQLMYHNGDEVQADEIHSLRQELDDLKSERDRFADLLKTAGISTLLNATNSWKGRKANCTSSTSDCRPESADTTSNIPQLSTDNSKRDKDQEGSAKSAKSKRRNTICAQLERIQKENQSAKVTPASKMNTGNIIIPGLNQLNGLQTANVLPTNLNQQQLFAAAPNLPFSTLSNAILASNGHGHVIFSNANSAGGVVSIQAPTNQHGVTFVSPSPNLLTATDKGNGDGAGLLQIAMRDAGITTVTQSFLTQPSAQLPQITNQSTPAMIGSITSTNTEVVTSADSAQVAQSTPLQTLASIASNTQSINTAVIGSSFLGGTNCFQQGSTSMTNTTQTINTQVPIMSVGQTNYGQILQNGNTLINVPILNANGQALPMGGALPGLAGIQGLQTPQGQIVLVNDHGGVSLMPNLQMVVDPATLALSNSARQFTTSDKLAVTNKIEQSKMAFPGMMANQGDMINHTTTIPVQNQQQQSISFQNAINAQALAANPAAAAAMQQLAYQHPQHALSLGAANTILQQPQQLGATASVATTTTTTQQQQPMLPTQFAGQNANFLNPNPGLVLPVSQNGNLLTLNTVPSQPNQLPTALILPNGHIIPVVTQPQVLLQQQLQQQQLQQQQLQQQLLNANCQLQAAAAAAHPQTMHPSQLQAKVAMIGGLPNGTMPVMDSNLTQVLNPQNIQCQNQNAMLLSQQRAPVGLLMTTTMSSFPMSNAATTVASMNNNMVTTSATQSVMTTQVQSSQIHRPTSAPAFIKRSDTKTSDSKGVVMSTTTVQSQVQLKIPSTSAPESNVLLGNMPPSNSLATVGTVPSQNDTSAVISSTLQPNLPASLPLNQQTQVAGSNGTILITFGPPGQQSCCILNSNTMQGIGSIANPQPVLTSTASSSISTTTQSSSKKSNKKNSQRTIMPKPPKSDNSNTIGSVSSMNSSNSVSSTQVVSSGLWNSVSLNTDQEASSTSMQSVVSASEVCVTTSAESTITQSPTSHTSDNTGTTDILAKAAESIFSSSLHDISPPISSFYNPANEDNPLHIDTSAGETEDDCSAQSPSKESCDSDNIPTSSRIEMEVESQSSHSLDNTCNSLTVTSNSASGFFKETDICEAVGAISKRRRSKSEKDKLKITSKESKKLINTKKIAKKSMSMEISEAINFATTEFSEVLDHVEAVAIEKRKNKSVVKDTAKKATLKVPAKKPAQSVDIPDEIVFTESEISDVLDQVENLRNSWGGETDPKKIKNRKVKSSCPEPDSEQPLNKKKRRVGKDYDSLLDEEVVKMNSSDCDNSISIEENPSELLSPDSTTVTKNVNNYTPSSTDGSPTGSGGESICEKGVGYDPYDISLSLDEPEPIKSFRSVDHSKSLCESNSHISDSYSSKIAERPHSAAEEISCTTSVQVTNSRTNSRMLITSPASTGNGNNVENDSRGENNRIKTNGIVEQKQLHLHCDPQPSSNADDDDDDMLSKNSCSDQQMSTTSQATSVNNLPSSQSQHQSPCNLQSQHISTPTSSLPPSVNSISTSVDPNEGNCTNSSAQMTPPCTTEPNSYSSPNSLRYSAESLFNPSNKMTTQSKPPLQSQAQIIIPHHTSNITNSLGGGEALSTTATAASVSSSKSRNSGIYSAENFVQSGRNDTSRSDNKHSYSSAVFSSANNTVHHLSTSETDALSFSNLGLSLTPTSSSSSTSSNTYSESSTCGTSTSFTFSLTNSNNNSIFPSHQFPFLHLHSLVTSQHLHNDNTDSVNSNQQSQTFGLPSFGLNNQRNNNDSETSVPQNTPSGQIIVSGSSTTANHLQPHNTFNFGLGSSIESCSSSRNQTFQDGSSLSLNSSGIDKSSSNGNVLSSTETNRDNSNPKHLPNVAQSISLSSRPPQQPSLNTNDCSAQITSSVSTYFTPMNYQSLHTPPLHHPPVTSSESARANISRSFNANLSTPMTNFASSTPVFNGRFDSNQLFSSQRDAASQNLNLNSDATKSVPHQISKLSKQQQSTTHHSLTQAQTQPTVGSLSSHQPIHSSSSSSSSSSTSISTSPHVSNLGASHQSTSQIQQPPIQQQPQQPTPPQQQQRSAKQNSRAKQSQNKKNKQSSFSDVDSNLSQSIFEPNMALYFSITNTSPPPPPPPPPPSSRTIQSDTPSFMSGNLFTSSARQIANTSSTVLKNTDISTSFGTIFPPSRTQNGIGLNFQTGFGMNTVHSGHSNTPQIPPHSSSMPNLPHMSSLSLSNIFPDVSTSQSEALNISPIKFHTNSILPPPPPQAGMDPNALQHHHQSGALYHNRGHPPPPPPPPVIHNMSINSILGHNPHSFEARGPVAQAINSTVAPGFHGPSHSTFPMPPLNFSMHEH